ncbi:MAG: ATP-binding protein [Gammaproteobacteria bacterium]|nr:ATP-binding protein [Gammaproteobacteria bacterium]MYJ75284.1 ATP-binding protein [Gammaproteobacteria bacterium]
MNDFLPRAIEGRLANHLRVMPAVVVSGARQTGKSTLARRLVPESRRFATLDDLDVLDAAQRDPTSLFGDEPITLDEIQRAPELLLAIKRRIDEQRRPGQFLLTGSANLALIARVSESLAGRAGYLTLWPMTRREQLGLGCTGCWDQLLAASDSAWEDVAMAQPAAREEWRDVVRRGGYPDPAVHLADDADRAIWFDGYLRTYLERDLAALSSVASLVDFRRLVRAACLRVGQVANQTEIGRDVVLPQPTVHRYLNLLETSYLLARLPAYAVNRTKRLIKSPKLYWCDTGLALRIAGADPAPAHLENLVLCDLLAWRESRPDPAEVTYWRTTAGEEVDFVIETGDALLPIEIKATVNPRLRDSTRLRVFRREYPDRARAGLLLHDGHRVEWLAPDVLAVPWWRVI